MTCGHALHLAFLRRWRRVCLRNGLQGSTCRRLAVRQRLQPAEARQSQRFANCCDWRVRETWRSDYVTKGDTLNSMPVQKVLLAEPRGFCAGVEMAIKALA